MTSWFSREILCLAKECIVVYTIVYDLVDNKVCPSGLLAVRTNRSSNHTEVTFHCFSEDKIRQSSRNRSISRSVGSHQICSRHFLSRRPSKDPNNVDYIPTIFTDAKRRANIVKLYSKRSDRALERLQAWPSPALH